MMANQRTGKFWPKRLFNINFDQKIFACLFLDVCLKIVVGALPCIWHED